MYSLSEKQAGETLVITIDDEKIMDPHAIEVLGSDFLKILEGVNQQGSTGIVINFSNVTFFASSAINKLIILEKHCRANQTGLTLCGLQKDVLDLFAYTSLDQMFKITKDEETALAQ